MKITDINTMTGPWMFPLRFSDADGLLKNMDDYRISNAVTYHSAAKLDPVKYNREMSDIAYSSKNRIYACSIIDPILYNRQELYETLMELKPSAARMFPRSSRFILNGFYCDHILSVLNSFHMPLLLDADEAPDFKDLPELASSYPDMPFILLNCHFNSSRYITPLVTKLDNIYFDMSTLINTGYIEELVNERCGSGRLLFGSGLPFHVPAGSLAMIFYSKIDDDDKSNILSLNWDRLMEGICYDN
jgi:uncharacterized protein